MWNVIVKVDHGTEKKILELAMRSGFNLKERGVTGKVVALSFFSETAFLLNREQFEDDCFSAGAMETKAYN